MKKALVLLVLLLITSLFFVFGASALNPYNVDQDTWVDGSTNNYNGSGSLRIFSSSAGTCSPALATLLQVDMTQIIQDTVGTVTLDVVVHTGTSVSGSVTLELFESTSDFDETTAAGPRTAWVGSSLGSTVNLDNTTPVGTTLTFPSTAAFVSYVEAARTGDGNASVVIQMTSCPLGAQSVELDERETGQAAQFSFWNPSNVSISNLNATSAPSHLLWAAFGLILVLSSAALFYLRRRSRSTENNL